MRISSRLGTHNVGEARARRRVWARPRDLDALRVRGNHSGRVQLGHIGGLMGNGQARIAAPAYHPILVVGPPRCGKTSSVVVPAIRDWDGPVVATSVRADIVQDSVDARRALGVPVLLFDPTGACGVGSSTWTPLQAARGSWDGARRMAYVLVDSAGLADGGKRRDVWSTAGADLLAPLLYAGALLGPSMRPVMQWLHDPEGSRDELEALLIDHPEPLQVLRSVWDAGDRLRDSIFFSARVSLSAYADSGVLDTSEGADITPASVLAGATLYIVASPRDQERLAPLFAAIITSIVDAAYDESTRIASDGSGLLLALDEAANVAPLRDLATYATTAAGSRIQLVTVLQNLSQAVDRWGGDTAKTIIDGHSVRVVFGGSGDEQTLSWAQNVVGDVAIVDRSRNRGALGHHGGVSESVTYRPIVSSDELRRLPRGHALLVAHDALPAVLDVRPWNAT